MKKDSRKKQAPGDQKVLLRKIGLFDDLSDAEVNTVLSLMREQKARKGAVIFHQHDEGNGLFLILEGSVKISRIGRDGREITIALLREGNFFGEMSILDSQPRSATAAAVTACRFLVLDRESFFGGVLAMRGVAAKMLSELSKRLRAANQNMENLALGTVYDRLFHFLGHLARRFPLVEGSCAINSRPTHQELAEIVGSSRETVTRTLALMEKQGIIELRGRKIIVLPAFFDEENARS